MLISEGLRRDGYYVKKEVLKLPAKVSGVIGLHTYLRSPIDYTSTVCYLENMC